MNIINLYQTHEFLKQHELEPTADKTLKICKHCRMAFIDTWGTVERITDTCPPCIDNTKQLIKLIPQELLQFKGTINNVYALTWYAILSGDKDGALLTEIAMHCSAKKQYTEALSAYAMFVRRTKDLDKAILNGGFYSHIMGQYCIIINDVPEGFREKQTTSHDKQYWYRNVDKPIFNKKILKLDKEKEYLWGKMRCYWNNTKVYNSPWYKKMESEHRDIVAEVKQLKARKAELLKTMK